MCVRKGRDCGREWACYGELKTQSFIVPDEYSLSLQVSELKR